MTSPGLTSEEAQRRRAALGDNALPAAHRRGFGRLVLGILREPMFLLLLAATGLYVMFGDLVEALTLGASVVVIMGIEVVQQRRTDNALEALRDLASPTARVRRDGEWRLVDARLLVPDDLIQVSEGDRVPADARLCEGAPVSVDESLLTGESVPVVRQPDREDAVFAGTLVTSGHALGVVTATGPRSQMGHIGATLDTIALAEPPIEREIAHLVPRLAAIALGLAAVLVLIRGVREGDWLAGALSGITLAISLLPEELPVVLTVFFTLGARRLARHGVLARRAAAIETLGTITVLCVDKTGTLTENRMSIARIASGVGAGVNEVSIDQSTSALPDEVHDVVEYGLLACPPHPTDPMDRAFAALAARTLGDTEHVHPRWTPVREYPLRSRLLAVTHAWRHDDAGHVVVASKGAPDAIFELCHLPAAATDAWRARAHAMAAGGLRVLGVARAVFEGGEPPDDPHAFTFEIAGLVGLADPVRVDTAEAVARCHTAGIRVVMVTGDHPETARAIATASGIPSEDVVTGAELEQLDDDALVERLARTHVVARAVPAHKLRIVRALQAAGECVGMTGDGVNDAPALAAADIGIAMGGRGSDVAREAAGLVLVHDDLRSIAEAVRIGRTIFENMRSSIGYLVAVHPAIAGIALVPPLLGWGALLAPIHVLFIELVIDSTCSVVFEMDPPPRDIMMRPPRRRGVSLFEVRRLLASTGLGALALASGLAAIAWGRARGLELGAMSSIAFVVLISGNLAILIASRVQPLRANRAAVFVLGAAVSLCGFILLVPPVAHVFAFAPPSFGTLALAAAIGALPILAVHAAARAARPRAGRPAATTSSPRSRPRSSWPAPWRSSGSRA